MKSFETICRRGRMAAAISGLSILAASRAHAEAIATSIPAALAEGVAKIFRPNDVGDAIELGILVSLIVALLRLIQSRNAALRSAHEMQSLLTRVEAQAQAQKAEMEEHNRELERTQKALGDANAQLTAMATIDGLTGVRNRPAFHEELDALWQRYRRYATPVSLILIDLDHFKAYNEAFGRTGGDIALEKVAKVISGVIRQTDFVARFEGQEFVVLAPETGVDGAMLLAERLRVGIEEAHWPRRAITASFGVATSWTAVNADDLIESAAVALQRSKTEGRNCITQWEVLRKEAQV